MRLLPITLLLWAANASADPETAAKERHIAEALADTGDFQGAAEHYEAAFEADPQPDLICNVGVAFYKAKDLPRAQLMLTRCLERGTTLESGFVENVRSVLAQVESTLKAGEYTPIDIVVKPAGADVTISAFRPREGFVGSRVIWLPFGKHVIEVKAVGHVGAQREVEATDRNTKQIVVELDVEKPPPKPPRLVTVHKSKVPPVMASVGTLGAIIIAGIAYQEAHHQSDIARFAINPDVFEADRNAVSSWNTVFVISGSLAVAGAALSGFLWYGAMQTSTRLEVNASAESATLTFRGSF